MPVAVDKGPALHAKAQIRFRGRDMDFFLALQMVHNSLLHGVMCNFQHPANLEEKQLEERLKGLQIDMGNIARIIADTVKKDRQQILNDMLNRTTLYPEQAVEYGLVHEIKSELFEPGAEVISIQASQQTPHSMPQQHPLPTPAPRPPSTK